MGKKLVIVESPGKLKKIGEILGKDYIVEASFGHCRDLDSNEKQILCNYSFKNLLSNTNHFNIIFEITFNNNKI